MMWASLLFFAVAANAQFYPSPSQPTTPQWLQYECNLTGQVITYTQKFVLERCSCGCSSQFLPCSNNVINDFCCQPSGCSGGAFFQKCFNRQLQCPTLVVQLVLNNVNHTAAKSCKCGDAVCLQGLQSFLNMTTTPCWTNGVEFVFEDPYNTSDSGLSKSALIAIIIGSIISGGLLIYMGYKCYEGSKKAYIAQSRSIQSVLVQSNLSVQNQQRRYEEEKKKDDAKRARNWYYPNYDLNISNPPIEPDCPPPYNVPNPPLDNVPPPYNPPNDDNCGRDNNDNNDNDNDNGCDDAGGDAGGD